MRYGRFLARQAAVMTRRSLIQPTSDRRTACRGVYPHRTHNPLPFNNARIHAKRAQQPHSGFRNGTCLRSQVLHQPHLPVSSQYRFQTWHCLATELIAQNRCGGDPACSFKYLRW